MRTRILILQTRLTTLRSKDLDRKSPKLLILGLIVKKRFKEQLGEAGEGFK